MDIYNPVLSRPVLFANLWLNREQTPLKFPGRSKFTEKDLPC